MKERQFSYRALLRESVRREGIFATIARVLRGGWELLRDLLPSRRRLRFGDLDFDWEHRVDTTWSNVGFSTRFREIFTGRGYQATDPVIFREMMEHVTADVRSFTFIDLGCGKGRALLLAREYGFRKIVGVELLPELLEIARQNIARLPAEEQTRFELVGADALKFQFPNEPVFLYLFDPLPAAGLAELIGNLERAVLEHRLPTVVAYQNPVSEHVLASSKAFRKIGGTQQWALYEYVP